MRNKTVIPCRFFVFFTLSSTCSELFPFYSRNIHQRSCEFDRRVFPTGRRRPGRKGPAVLENGAFLSERDNFYRAEITQSEPIKGNYTSVARCRLSGILLGPTNHHAYQPQLRSLYEQRFSRRMSFADYQRQIEIVSNPEAVERWKEEVRSVTTYVTLQEEPGVTFPNAAETERHFRQTYLPALIRNSAELTLDGSLVGGCPIVP